MSLPLDFPAAWLPATVDLFVVPVLLLVLLLGVGPKGQPIVVGHGLLVGFGVVLPVHQCPFLVGQLRVAVLVEFGQGLKEGTGDGMFKQRVTGAPVCRREK